LFNSLTICVLFYFSFN